MPQLTVKKAGETPSERIAKDANASTTITDRQGRRIEIRRLTPLDRMRMSRAAGPENATNGPYMSYALVACSVVGIDGHEMISPQTQLHLEAVIARLGDDGYEAVLEAVVALYPEAGERATVEEAKN